MTSIHKKVKKYFGKESEKYAAKDDSQENLLGINDLYSNHSFNFGKMALFKRVMFGEGSFIPHFIEVDCKLYHGAEEIFTPVTSKRVYFNNCAKFNQWIYFEHLRYCQLPKKTRLSFNIIMTTVENVKITIGTVSMNIFDDQGKLNSGI